MDLRVDGVAVSVPEGATILEACDLAGRYVPRLCSYPGLGCACELGVCCGLCAVHIEDGAAETVGTVLACSTPARAGMAVTTFGPALTSARLRRLASILDRHPHVCLSCPYRDGCSRQECPFGYPDEARCCAEFGRCEIGKLLAFMDPGAEIPRRPVGVSRDSINEGRIRRELGLCVACGRCVVVCTSSPAAGNALRLEPAPNGGGALQAAPVDASLRASGCTFCGQCVMVCPTGAITAPGEAGARWLQGRRERTPLAAPVLPPESGWRPLTAAQIAAITLGPGVLQVADEAGRVLLISGVADLARALAAASVEPAYAAATRFRVEQAELFTQRESELLARFVQDNGHLPPGNDIGDDLFEDDDLFDEDLD